MLNFFSYQRISCQKEITNLGTSCCWGRGSHEILGETLTSGAVNAFYFALPYPNSLLFSEQLIGIFMGIKHLKVHAGGFSAKPSSHSLAFPLFWNI